MAFNRVYTTESTELLVDFPDYGETLTERVHGIFNDWDKHLQIDHSYPESRVSIADTVAYTFYTSERGHWQVIDSVRRKWWKTTYPTSTFLVTAMRPDNLPWGDNTVGIEPVAVSHKLEINNVFLDINQFQTASEYAHAKIVETPTYREVFFSGMCGVAGNPQEGYHILGEGLVQQAHHALMYCEQLCGKAGITRDQVNHVDVFYVPPYLPKYAVGAILYATVDEKTQGFFPKATIKLIPVTGLFMPGLVVEIRPHAVVWKE